jgi:hypothetical protein
MDMYDSISYIGDDSRVEYGEDKIDLTAIMKDGGGGGGGGGGGSRPKSPAYSRKDSTVITR